MSTESKTALFGGDQPWSPRDWTASDDQVRGGSSYSIFDCNASSPTAFFHGHLDTQTLGGAGFASQRTTGEDRTWDLSHYDGLELDIGRSDGKTYTVTLKDTIPSKRPDGRDESTLSWEYDFRVLKREKIFVKWSDFKPTYRGKEQKDAKPLDLGNVKRISLMARSFFDTQEGDFFLEVHSIAASRTAIYQDDTDYEWVSLDNYGEKGASSKHGQGMFEWLLETCGIIRGR
ncbi:complex I intermediate-associated protein 30-domain-containing protein [Aspergillus ambiguus]|uniref:CIA30 family protein n=1 Tax=Aspergillus ambiguus TaxID=176160 RepID=UPI003CCDC1DC